jgi:hypothetical protein
VAFLPCLPRATRPPARSGSINRLGLYGFGPLCDVQAEPVEVVVLSTNSNERNSGDPQSNLQGDPQIAKYRNEKLNRELIELLGELRVAIPGCRCSSPSCSSCRSAKGSPP